MIKNLINNIFSVQDNEQKTHKILTILGIKIKYKKATIKGIKGIIEEQNQKISELTKETEALRILLNNCIDITKVPKARGALRELQLADTVLLEIFDKICKKNNLEYWLDGGTLLGQVRHQGFIPWDDDIDIGMLREDYNKSIEIFKKELPQDLFEINEGKRFYRKVVRIILKNSPIQIDIWPFDKFNKENLSEDEKNSLRQKILNCYNLFWTKFSQDLIYSGEQSFPRTELANFINEYILDNNLNFSEKPILFRGPEAWLGERCVYDWDDFFPLKKANFEGLELPIPNSPEIFLKKYYGDYMKLPDLTQAVEGHTNIDKNLSIINKNKGILENINKNFG